MVDVSIAFQTLAQHPYANLGQLMVLSDQCQAMLVRQLVSDRLPDDIFGLVTLAILPARAKMQYIHLTYNKHEIRKQRCRNL